MEAPLVKLLRQRRTAFKPVEPGVTGKERMFQQNRNFGPGPIKPYPPGTRSGEPNANRRMQDGVYRGPARNTARRV